jgi:hypothetical protein
VVLLLLSFFLLHFFRLLCAGLGLLSKDYLEDKIDILQLAVQIKAVRKFLWCHIFADVRIFAKRRWKI